MGYQKSEDSRHICYVLGMVRSTFIICTLIRRSRARIWTEIRLIQSCTCTSTTYSLPVALLSSHLVLDLSYFLQVMFQCSWICIIFKKFRILWCLPISKINHMHTSAAPKKIDSLLKLQESIYGFGIQCTVLRCLFPLMQRLFHQEQSSSNPENCLNMFICEAYKACWTGIPEKCFHLPIWHWSTAVDIPTLIWTVPCFGESKPSNL